MIPKINLVDTNNYARIKFETDPFALRSLFEHAFRDPEPYIFVFDGRNAKASRRAIFPGYKVGRQAAPDNFYKQLEIFQELLMYTNKVQLKVDGYEADDVIGTLVKNPGAEYLIHSNDGDFMTLVNDHVRVTTPTIKDIAPNEIRLYKTLKGDGSDKIPGVRLFGPKSWAALTPQGKLDWYAVMATLEGLDPLNESATFELPEGDFNLTKLQTSWVNENWRLVRAFWLVVGFQTVPQDVMSKAMKVGTPRYDLGNSLLAELLL